jgi:hypothetical protein
MRRRFRLVVVVGLGRIARYGLWRSGLGIGLLAHDRFS